MQGPPIKSNQHPEEVCLISEIREGDLWRIREDLKIIHTAEIIYNIISYGSKCMWKNNVLHSIISCLSIACMPAYEIVYSIVMHTTAFKLT